MGVLIAGTETVRLDEPCFGLAELNLQSPGSKGWRRYQVLQVVRNDRIAEHRRDLGPAGLFVAPQFRIPGGVIDEATGRIEILHTVGELVDIADYQRDGRFAQPEIVPRDLIAGYHDQLDKNAKARRRVSHFGHLHRVQRN